MATVTESSRPDILTPDGLDQSTRPRSHRTKPTIPPATPGIPASSYTNMSAPATAGEPMDIAPSSSETNGINTSPGTGSSQVDGEVDGKANDRPKNESNSDPNSSGSNNVLNMTAPPPAAAALHQPKIVQTAFIHKLYKWVLG